MKRTPETTESDHSVRTPEASNCGAGGLPARSELVLPASRDKLPNELPAISPTLIEAFFGGVKERFLLRQQAQTVHTRLELFESLLRQQNRISELQLRRTEIQQQLRQSAELEALKLEVAQHELRVRVARSRRTIAELKRPPACFTTPLPIVTSSPSPAQILQGTIERLKTEKVFALARAKTEEERMWLENLIDERIRDLEQQRLELDWK